MLGAVLVIFSFSDRVGEECFVWVFVAVFGDRLFLFVFVRADLGGKLIFLKTVG